MKTLVKLFCVDTVKGNHNNLLFVSVIRILTFGDKGAFTQGINNGIIEPKIIYEANESANKKFRPTFFNQKLWQ